MAISTALTDVTHVTYPQVGAVVFSRSIPRLLTPLIVSVSALAVRINLRVKCVPNKKFDRLAE